MLARFAARAKKAYEHSAGYACEATSAIRTVASLTREEDVFYDHKHSFTVIYVGDNKHTQESLGSQTSVSAALVKTSDDFAGRVVA